MTWEELYNQMMADLINGKWLVKSYTIANRTVQYRSFEEFRHAIEFVKEQINKGKQTKTKIGRTYAKNGGR